MSDIAADLQTWRDAMHLTQRAAADALGVRYDALRGWEAGRSCRYPDLLRVAMRGLAREREVPINAPFDPRASACHD